MAKAKAAGICIRNETTGKIMAISVNSDDKIFKVYEVDKNDTKVRYCKKRTTVFEEAVNYAITNVIDKPGNE